jgi:hypothetical protein
VPSASPHLSRLGLAVICGALLAALAGGCSTTQEKAQHQKVRAEHILEARAKRQKHPAGGTKSGVAVDKSADRQKEGK